MKHENVFFGGMTLIGLAALVAPRWFIVQRQRLWQRRAADRQRRGIDAYFEEPRQLEAYAPTANVWKTRLGGAVLFLLAGTFFASDFLSH